jgi:hypothetical protein
MTPISVSLRPPDVLSRSLARVAFCTGVNMEEIGNALIDENHTFIASLSGKMIKIIGQTSR